MTDFAAAAQHTCFAAGCVICCMSSTLKSLQHRLVPYLQQQVTVFLATLLCFYIDGLGGCNALPSLGGRYLCGATSSGFNLQIVHAKFICPNSFTTLFVCLTKCVHLHSARSCMSSVMKASLGRLDRRNGSTAGVCKPIGCLILYSLDCISMSRLCALARWNGERHQRLDVCMHASSMDSCTAGVVGELTPAKSVELWNCLQIQNDSVLAKE